MFEWQNEYSVQIVSVDAQHKVLFAISQELYNAMMAGRSKASLAKILDRLVQYTKTHFAHEERLMQQHGYPAFEAHKAEHEALTRRVLQFQEDFEQGRVNMSVQLLQFLRDWLDKHIKGSDHKYSPFLRENAVA
jgi:hemerythrin